MPPAGIWISSTIRSAVVICYYHPKYGQFFAMAHYTGCFSADTLFDSLEAQVPTEAGMRQAAMLDDCASARFFMRTVDAFISHVLGIDPKTTQSRNEGGLFGKTKAYFGMVETQGRGTLHIHFLVWIFNAPRNSTEFEDKLRVGEQEFKNSITAYVDSIVTNQLPLSVDDSESSELGIHLFPTTREYDSRIQGILTQFDEYGLLRNIAHHVANHEAYCEFSRPSSSRPNISVHELKRWVTDDAFDSTPAVLVSSDSTKFADRQTSVNEIIDEMLQPDQIIWKPVSYERVNATIPPYSGISTLSQAFTLNKLQHGAFAIIATHLLKRWRHDPSNYALFISDETLREQQLLLFLGGEGGTGKSRVIGALREFCSSWQRSDSIILSALTGKAASIISGRTLASLEKILSSPNGRAAVQSMDCLVIDEVSMMTKHQLLNLDRLLRKSKQVPNVTFGGVHIVLVGDFLQLPPVCAEPLFVDPSQSMKASFSEFEGYTLWRKFKKVVVLMESVRFNADPEWGVGCSRARYGEWTAEFLKLINDRVAGQGSYGSNTGYPPIVPQGTVFVTPDNDTRTAINNHFISTTAKILPAGDFPIRVVANFKGGLNNLSQEDIMRIMSLPDSRFRRMAPYLDLIMGMPIQITQNVRTKKGVANGTMGYLESVYFPPQTNVTQVQDMRTGVVVVLPDKRPLYALVRLNRGPNAHPIIDSVDPAIFPVFPDAEAFQKVTIDLTKSSTGECRSLSIKIQQFPFVCAVGATVYKVQGDSLQSMSVVDWKSRVPGANKPQQVYLMVSRIVKREGFVCMKPLTSAIASWSKPPTTAIDEDNRLRAESDKTLSMFYNNNEAVGG